MSVDNENIEDFPEIDEAFKNISKDTKKYVSHALSISEYVAIKLGDTPQKKLAEDLDKSQAEISKWLSGTHNMTLRTISKLEAALDIDIINPEIIEFVKKHYGVITTPIVEMHPKYIYLSKPEKGWHHDTLSTPTSLKSNTQDSNKISLEA